LAIIDDLLADNRRQLEKLLDLYLSGDFDKEMLTDRKARLETTIGALEKERADLLATLEVQTLTDDQIMTIEDFAREVAGGLEEAEASFDARRHIIDLLDVRVTLTIEEGQKVAYVRCLVDETALSIEPTNTHFAAVDNRAEGETRTIEKRSHSCYNMVEQQHPLPGEVLW
jgi:hypothetical protein